MSPKHPVLTLICLGALALGSAACSKKTSGGAGSGSAALGSGSGSASGAGTSSGSGVAAAGSGAGSARAKLAQALGKLAKASKALDKAGRLGAVLDWKALQPFLPDTLGTLPAVDPVSGQNTNMGPMNVSMVRRSYGVKKSAKVAGTRARVQIIDTAQAPMMRAMVGMGSKMKGDAESVSETTKVGGHPALLRWHRPTMTGKMSLLVGGRFLINMGVRPIKGIAEGKSLLAKLDIAKLATLAASKAKEAAAAKKKAATK